MKKIPVIVLLAAFFISCFSPAYADDKVRLQYDFKVGAQLNYKMKIDGDVTIQVNPDSESAPPKNTAKMDGDFNYTHEVTAVDPEKKTAKVNVIYGKSQMFTIVNGQKIPNNDVPLLEGKTAIIKVSSDGEVLDYELPDGLPDSLQNADFKKMFTIFPDRQLRIGESWIENSEDVNDDNENYTVRNVTNSTKTLVGIEKKGRLECAKIKVVGNTTTVTVSKEPKLNINGKIESRLEGTVYYDLQRGYIVHSVLHNKINNIVTTGSEGAKQVKTILNTDLNTVIDLL